MAATLQRGHIIEDEGVAVTQRATLNFTGPGVNVFDAGGKTVADIQGGAPSGAAGGVLAGAYPNPIFSSDMATQAELEAWRLDEVAAPTGDVSLNNQKIIGLEAPTNPTEAANKAYVDAVASGFDVKVSVRAATTANITLSGAQTIDGVSVIATNRVLVKNQTAAEENGIYVAAAGAWARSTDADTDAEVTSGMFTFIEEGTLNAEQGWALATDDPIVVGTTDLVFTQVAGVGGGGSPTGAAGGVLSGSYPNPGFADAMATDAEVAAAVAAHVNDATAAHAATAISFTPDGSISATNVQAAIIEVRDEAGGGGGGTVDDQTIVTTDNAVNDMSASKHGWAKKGTGFRSHYLGGTGQWEALYPIVPKEIFVDAGAPGGGDGLTRRTCFTSFASANALANEGDIIYIMSDLHENCVLTKARVHVRGLGRVIIYGSGSTSANNITFNVTATECILENLTFAGSSLFKGIHLCMNRRSNYFRLKDISIFGGGFATYYPTSPGAGTGVGGIGILCHGAEHGRADNLWLQDLSIGVGLGTWSTQNEWTNVLGTQNCQDLVAGLYTGPNGGQAVTSSPFGYGLAAQGANDQCGFNTFRGWRCVSNVVLAGNPPSIDLIGDGTYNYVGSSGGQHLFENCALSETGAAGPLIFRIGSCFNTFVGCQISKPMFFNVAGQRNRFVNLSMTNSLALNSDYNVVDGAFHMPSFNPVIYGIGSYNTIRNSQVWNPSGDPISISGLGWKYDGCLFDGTAAITRANLGALVNVSGIEGVSYVTYGTTVQLYPAGASMHVITVTNGTAFTIANPLDHFNQSSTTSILISTPLTIDILNSSGGAMGAITWGSKFALAGAFTNPASTKRRTITFYYNSTSDKWVETNRAAADI